MARISQTTPVTRWVSYASGFPIIFNSSLPKAIMINDAGNVVLEDATGNQVTFTPAIGIPIQLRPARIISTTASAVIALFD